MRLYGRDSSKRMFLLAYPLRTPMTPASRSGVLGQPRRRRVEQWEKERAVEPFFHGDWHRYPSNTGKAAGLARSCRPTILAVIRSGCRCAFDAMVSHDITYVGIIQQAKASGMKEFPIPYAPDQLPQQPVRRGRHHQRGRPYVRPVRRQKVRRHLCARQPERHPLLRPGGAGRVRSR